ncbi:nicotinate-nucleotide pyrophosphorylase [Sulfolobus acidocaldarius SUSAZ]|nr:nicotinate-nucleotide pyrophosphorylase [Sulfolobus acidocaldarius SUSAZ]
MIEKLVINRLLQLLEEDLYPEDITSRVIRGVKVKGIIFSKENNSILAGNKFIIPFLEYLGLKVDYYRKDGELFSKGENILIFQGDAEAVLGVERLVLNMLSRLSAIATETRKMVNVAREINPKVIIAGTRKTTPGLRIFEKYAIEIGGGDPHRYSLYDMVLIKDNHISIIGNIKDAIKRAKEITSFSKKIEVEVSNINDAIEAYKAGADIIMLDNFSPQEVKEVVKLLKGKVLLEASGRVTPENVKEYAETGVDIISSGYLTHSVRSLDLSMDVEKLT